MKAIHKAMIVVFAMFLLAAPLIVSSHGKAARTGVVDQQRSSVLEQRDNKRIDASGIVNTQETTGTDKSIGSEEPSAAIAPGNVDGGQRNPCSLIFCRKCEEAGGTCIHTDHGCYCE